MGGAVKVFSLLSAPLPLLYPHRASSFLRLSSAAFISYRRLRLLSESPRRSSCNLRSSRQSQRQSLSSEPHAHHDLLNSKTEYVAPAWPEWARLVRWLSEEGYVERAVAAGDGLWEDGFVERKDLPEEFVRAADALILFARENPDLLRSLSKKEIGIVVDSGSAFLFKDGERSMRRLRNFLNSDNNDVLQPEKAETIDLVRFLLCYASLFENDGTNVASNASVKNLLVELITQSGTTRLPNFTDQDQSQPLSQQQALLSRPPEKTISRKAGDWFCSKCNFMNFERNTKCLECSEPKPKRILTGKEWECPQCNFFNYGKNMSCLRCDCKRPGEIPLPSTSSGKTSTLEDILNKSTIKVSSSAPHNIRTSGNGYVPIKDPAVSQTVDRIIGREPNKISWESLANQRQEPGHVPFNPLPADMFANPNTTEVEDKSSPSDSKFPEMMPVRKGENRFVVSRKKNRSLTSPQYKRRIAMEQANNSNFEFVPFVPLPADYFAKKRENNELLQMGHGSEKTEENNKLPQTEPVSNKTEENDKLLQMGPVTEKTENTSSISTGISSSHETSGSSQRRGRLEYNYRQANISSTDFGHFVSFPRDYFARNREDIEQPQIGHTSIKTKGLNTVGTVASSSDEASDSDLPQQRNRPDYRNRQATNSNSNFRDFVPFPPDYFAKKRENKLSENEKAEFSATRSINTSFSHEAHHSALQRNKPEYDNGALTNIHSNSQEILSSQSGSGDVNGSNSAQASNLSGYNDGGYSYPKTSTSSSKDHWNRNIEGSSINELKPLDMSEEAKAERWFKRAAQIKDISELENIPDEDFPEIMPMRKGVNRFVVSKRKTPLVRRLASSQYRRNLPDLKSDSE